jgi:hypothetical protein
VTLEIEEEELDEAQNDAPQNPDEVPPVKSPDEVGVTPEAIDDALELAAAIEGGNDPVDARGCYCKSQPRRSTATMSPRRRKRTMGMPSSMGS